MPPPMPADDSLTPDPTRTADHPPSVATPDTRSHDPGVCEAPPTAPGGTFADRLAAFAAAGTADRVVPSGQPDTVDVSQPGHSTNATRPSLPPPPVDAPSIRGYAITAEIAKGGMGRVYAGRDLSLDRDVAIKTLLPGANANRFVTEAKITAKLPHPNIPPVYSLGTLDDGTPWLAMKLIRGQTLARLLKDRTSPKDDLPRFVHIFEQIAQAVGFSHSRGIIHRDLKPLNVMVGEFGEVQVMDWGLAKDTGSDEDAASSGTESDGEGLTRAGTIMGTPGYMAPEQARGEVVDTRADVFALGSMLAAILTGTPAFHGTTASDTIEKTARSELDDVFARLDESGSDPDLVALAKHCLGARAEDRPTDARGVAEEVAEYRTSVENRLQQAREEEARAIVRDAERSKRRRLVQIATGVVVAVLVVGIIGTAIGLVRANIAAEKEHEASNAATTALGEVKESQKQLSVALNDVTKARSLEQEATLKQTKNLYTAHMNLVQRAWEQSDIKHARELLERHIPEDENSPDFRGFEWYYYWRLTHSAQLALTDLPAAVRVTAISPDGTQLAYALVTGAAFRWDTDGKAAPERIEVPGHVSCLAYSPDGKWLAIGTGRGTVAGEVHLVETDSWKAKHTLKV